MQYHTKQCSNFPVMHTIRHTALIHHRHLPALRSHNTSHRCWRLTQATCPMHSIPLMNACLATHLHSSPHRHNMLTQVSSTVLDSH
jgi:hypothetical protein